MIFFIIAMVKSWMFGLFSTVKARFKAAALSFLLVAAFLFSSASAFAAFVPAYLPSLGADGYIMASLIAGLMGVDISYNDMSATLNMNMFHPAVSPSSDGMIWVKHIGSGVCQFGLNKFGYQYYADTSSGFISSAGITDNSSGSLFSGSVYHGVDFPLRISNILYASNPISSGSNSWPSGPALTLSYSGYSVVISPGNPGTIVWYNPDGSIYSTISGIRFSGSQSWQLRLLHDTNTHFVDLGLSRTGGSYNGWTGPRIGVSSTASSSYSSGIVDTSVGSSLPASGGAVISFPYSGPEDTFSALAVLNDLVLSGDPSVSIELTDDVGVPEVSTQVISDTPWSSLSSFLHSISSGISDIVSSVGSIAESIVGADSTFFGNIVSALATPFEPVFAVFRSGVGIWHYVVSWVGTISAPFAWSISALGSAGSYFLSPLYATAAAAVVLAVYKKFGR